MVGITLNLHNNKLPTLSQLADITRIFNRTFPFIHLTIVFKYNDLLTLANSESANYKQEWSKGEKIGKVSLLKDIDLKNPQRGHIAILKQLMIPKSSNKSIKSFIQLYYYWQSVFSISVLNKNFYIDIIAWFNNAVNVIKIPNQKPGSEKHKDFTIRLISRLFFIWFLKELQIVKEELLVPRFNNGFDNNLIKPKSNGTGYYKFILQNIFFNALNKEVKDRDINVFDEYSYNFIDKNSIKKAILFSPYLNGGLFDIQEENDWCEIDPSTKLHKVNNAIFSPTEYNCQILEKIIKPARSVYDSWWSKIESSRHIENNRVLIQKHVQSIKTNSITLIGLLTDGGQGLATGNNGKFVGYLSSTRFADRCRETRIQKLWEAIQNVPKIKQNYYQLLNCSSYDNIKEVLDNLNEIEIWKLFEGIKENFGLRVFGRGYMYRIIPDSMVFEINEITEKQKKGGIKGQKTYVPYDKGDKEGSRWYSETSYLIDWSEEAVSVLSTDENARWQGYRFFFRNGFCWSDVLNPNSSYVKCRLKGQSVNDIKSMSLYDETGLGDKYFVSPINSFLKFKVLREFLNSTIAIQINDIRKLPIKIPSENELSAFNKKFDECLVIKKEYYARKIDRKEMSLQLRSKEAEIDNLVNQLYGIESKEKIILDEFEEEV